VLERLRLPILHDSAWSAAAWICLATLSFGSSAIIFRYTGQESYGIWATIAALRSFVTLLDGGLALGVARDAARVDLDRENARARLAAARRVYALLGAAAVVVGLLGSDVPGMLLGLSGEARSTAQGVTMLLAVDTGIALGLSPMAALLRGRRHFRVLAAGSGMQAIIGLSLILLLTPRMGLLGPALALLIARSAPSVGYWLWLRSHERGLLVGSATGVHRTVLRFAAPLWLVALGTQIGLGTDVPIVGGVYGASVASAYAVGALLAATAAGLLYVVIDSTFPRLAAASATRLDDQVPRLMLGGTMLGVLGFSSLAMNGHAVITSWVGVAPALSLSVLTIYAASRAFNVPTHILSIAAIARGQHMLLAPIVMAEALISLVISIVLAITWDPLGPAVGTLATIAVSNLIIIPAILVRQLHLRWTRIATPAIVGSLIGLVLAVAIHQVAAGFSRPLIQTLVAAGLTAGVGVVAAAAALVGAGSRVGNLIRHGGIRVYGAEIAERITASRRLRHMRAAPTVWLRSDPPLVSVRIATYNRGALVADRAIASALRQTHGNIEVIVVGDQCDAKTQRAVLAVKDPRVRFENLAARGDYPSDPERRWMVAGTAPMNRALQLVRGAWIAPLDDDDEFTEDHIETLLEACRTRRLEFAYGIAEMEHQAGDWSQVGSWPLTRGGIIHASVLYSSRLRFFRHNLDAWRIDEPADWNMWRRMRNAGVHMGFVPQVVCRHYIERRGVPPQQQVAT
jgi:O-antigen/teichoic acid export membrane protein